MVSACRDFRKRQPMRFPSTTFSLPLWLEDFLADFDKTYPSPRDRMRLVVEMSRLNVERGTGGPFAAGVFDRETNRLFAPGLNLVVESGCSVAHAEIVALATAQRMRGHYDLAGEGSPGYELVSSAEPCAMCQGAIPWSGVRSLVCGARGEDALGIGFDEGIKAADWVAQFEARGISVMRDVCREEAAAVLRAYGDGGGIIYNGRRSGVARPGA